MYKVYLAVDENFIVTKYGISLNENHIPLENGIVIETDLDLEQISLVGNYKLIDGILVELTEEEKIPPTKEPNKIDILAQNVLDLVNIVEAILIGGYGE